MSGFPQELNYATVKPMSAGGRPQILRFRSDNSEYKGGDTARIEIPTGRSGMHLFPKDGFLEGKLKTNHLAGANTSTIVLDQCIYSIFKRLMVAHGTTNIEDTTYVNRIWTSLYDIQVNEAERRSDTITKLVFDNTVSTKGTIYSNGLFGIQVKTNATTVTADSSLYDFTIVLPSALLGCLAQKALPLGLMGASSIYLSLELEPANVPFSLTSAGTINSYTISELHYNAKCTVLPSDIERLIIESTGGIINLPAVAYKAEMKSIAVGSTSFNDKFAFQYSSIKNFCFFFSNSANAQGSTLNRSVSCRPKCGLSEWFINLNGEQYPSQSINTTSKMYMELMRSYDMMTDTNAGGIITIANYSRDTHTAADDAQADFTVDVSQKRFLTGVDLDRFNHSSEILLSGTNTMGQMVTLQCNFSTGITDNINLYAFVMYDIVYHLEGGLLVAHY